MAHEHVSRTKQPDEHEVGIMLMGDSCLDRDFSAKVFCEKADGSILQICG